MYVRSSYQMFDVYVGDELANAMSKVVVFSGYPVSANREC